jgi:hypothetical protein
MEPMVILGGRSTGLDAGVRETDLLTQDSTVSTPNSTDNFMEICPTEDETAKTARSID